MSATSQANAAPDPAAANAAQGIVFVSGKNLMLRAWIFSGLFFMAPPGTLLGFSNLLAISAQSRTRRAAGEVNPGFFSVCCCCKQVALCVSAWNHLLTRAS